jgi:hypothetical protein
MDERGLCDAKKLRHGWRFRRIFCGERSFPLDGSAALIPSNLMGLIPSNVTG